MDQNITDILNDAFKETETNFEQLNFGDDAATAHSINVPQNEPDMEEESSGSDSDIDLKWTNREEETKHCFENNRNFSLDEQSMKAGSTLCGSWDDNDAVKNKTQTQNQQLSFHEEDCRETEFEIYEDIHQTSKEQSEDVNVLEMVLPKGAHYGLDTMSTWTQVETTSHLLSYQMVDKSENESSTLKEERMEPDSTEEHVLEHGHFSAIQSTLQGWPVASVKVQSVDEIKEFTEEDHEDHEGDEEGLAEYPSDLSESDSGDSSEGHEGGQPNHMDTKQAEVQAVGLGCCYETKNPEEPLLPYSVVTSREEDDVQKKDERMDPADMLTYVKNEDLYVETTTGKSDDDVLFQTDAEYHREISNVGESSDYGISGNFQSISNESYTNEQPDYDSDFSSDGNDYCENQEDIPEFISHTVSEDKNTPLQKQEHTFTKDFAADWHSIEHEVVDGVVKDSLKPDMCNLEGLSSTHGTVMESSTETDSSENISVGESHPSVKTDQNNKEHNSEYSEVSDTGENINTFLPGTFWSQDVLKLDEYDWDINRGEVICDEEDNYLEELENDEEETERDWEKEKARIEAFNRYYESVEGEEIKGRSHKVTFCLEPESSQYEEDSYSSEEEPSTIGCISELHPPESSSVKQDQSNKEDSREPSHIRENISTLLMDEDNMKFDDYDCDINEEFKMNSSIRISDDNDDHDFLEKLKIEIERDMKQEQARIDASNRHYEGDQTEVTDRTNKVKFRFRQQSSQNEEDNESSEQESNTDDDTASIPRTEDQSDSDEPNDRRLYTGRYKVKVQKVDKQLKEQPKRNKCLVLLRSVLAVSLATAVGVLSYLWATDSLDWIY